MASGSKDIEPYIPSPDLTERSTEEWNEDLKKHTPPLRGLAVDPQYLPTKDDAEKVLRQMQRAGRERSLVENAPQRTLSENGDRQVDPYRSSGTSTILNQAPRANEVVNTMPGGDQRYNGGTDEDDVPTKFTGKDPTISNALKAIEFSDAKAFHQQPCVREALLQGGGVGTFAGGSLWIIGRSPMKAANVGFWAFMGTAFVGYQWCQQVRRKEKEGMRTAVHIIQEKEEEKRKRFQDLRAKRLKQKEEAQLEAQRKKLEESSARGGNSFKFWSSRTGSREG